MVGLSPVAEVERLPPQIHGAYRKDGRQSGGHMKTFTALVPGRGHQQDAAAGTLADCVLQQRMSHAGRRELPATNVDDLSTLLNRLRNGSGKIEL